jgi:hypothetical protein
MLKKKKIEIKCAFRSPTDKTVDLLGIAPPKTRKISESHVTRTKSMRSPEVVTMS